METVHKNHTRLVFSLSALVAGMIMLSFASVPLYRLFCQVTGYGGTTRDASIAATATPIVLNRNMNVFFNADTAPDLPLEFHPLGKDITFRIGEPQTVYYEASNSTSQPLEAVATFNVTPHEAGKYFVKVHCFCYEKQRFMPGETLKLPVIFYVDPAIADDPDMDGITHLTLSYTVFNPNRAE